MSRSVGQRAEGTEGRKAEGRNLTGGSHLRRSRGFGGQGGLPAANLFDLNDGP